MKSYLKQNVSQKQFKSYRFPVLRSSRWLFLMVFLWSSVIAYSQTKIILDTDMYVDHDDPAALAMVHGFMNTGEAELIAVTICSAENHAAGATDVVNTYYGRPDIPIGQYKGSAYSDGKQFLQDMADQFPSNIKTRSDVPDAVSVYRQILSQQPNNSVVIVSIGFLNNIEDLLRSNPDQYSNLNGVDLVNQKVAYWSCMGGHYPGPGSEFNFSKHPSATEYAIENFPRPIVFNGHALGLQIRTGAVFANAPNDNPMRLALTWNNPSWDQVAVYYAVRNGIGTFFNSVTTGFNDLNGGRNEWKNSPDKAHTYITLASGQKVPLENEIQAIYPLTPSSGGGGGGCTVGGSCNDGNTCTTGDAYDSNCNCVGTFQDADGDGICDANDTCDGSLAGQSCDDGDSNTTNDVYDSNCQCVGTPSGGGGGGSGCNNEVITNGTFSNGLNSWSPYVKTSSATASHSVVNNQLQTTISNGGTDGWHVKVTQTGRSLTSGTTYTASVKARASTNRTAQLLISIDGAPYTMFLNKQLNLNSNWQTFSYDFTPNTSSSNVRVLVEMGGQNGNVYLDDISVCSGGGGSSCTVGASCNDGDPCTTGDAYDSNCDCVGTFQDGDGDGICDANDNCDGSLAGQSCDDGDSTTSNDVYDSNCQCAGTPTGGGGGGGSCVLTGSIVTNVNPWCCGRTADKAFDGDLSTFVDHNSSSNGYVGLDLGSQKSIFKIRYAPRSGFAQRMVNAQFQGSNNGSNWTTFHTISAAPSQNQMTEVNVSANYRYYRYRSANGGHTNIAELEFVGSNCGGGPSCTVGASCNDGDNCTTGDAYDSNCNCVGTFQDADNDGICDANDTCDGSLAGQSCDDGDSTTTNDVYDSNCQCAGTPTGGGGGCNNEIITNGTFSNGLNSWSPYVNTGSANAAYSVVNNELQANISSGGSSGWHVKVTQTGLSLTAGTTYTVSLKARANTNRTAQLSIGIDGAPYTVFLNRQLSLTSNWQTFSYDFTPNTSSNNIRLIVEKGGQNGNVYLDDISVCSGGSNFNNTDPSGMNIRTNNMGGNAPITDELTPLHVQVNPNPASNEIAVYSTGHELHIFDLQGRLQLVQQTVPHQLSTIDINDWQTGVYIVKVIDKNGQSAMQKLVVY